jgi:hypothetical protein
MDDNGPAALQADFVSFKHLMTRKVIQLTFEVPAEAIQHALDVLGLPNTETGAPVVIARLVPEAERGKR